MSGPNPYRRETRDRRPHGNAVGIGGSPNKRAARGGPRPCFDLRRDEASHVALVQTSSAVGAIPTVDFLLYHFAVIVKKMAVKSQDWTRRQIQSFVARMERSVMRESLSVRTRHPGLRFAPSGLRH